MTHGSGTAVRQRCAARMSQSKNNILCCLLSHAETGLHTTCTGYVSEPNPAQPVGGSFAFSASQCLNALMLCRKESFPSPSAEGLAFYVYPAPGAPPPAAVPKPLAAPGEATAAADTPAPATPTYPPAQDRSSSKPPAATAPAAAGDVHNTPLLVLYGSNSGTCEAFAAQLVESGAAAGFAAAAATMDSLFAGSLDPQLPKTGAVLVVTST